METQLKQVRTYPNDPTPIEALEYIAEAVSELVNEVPWNPGEPYEKWIADTDAITLGQVKDAIAKRMQSNKIGRGSQRESEAFSSSYRHEDSELHSIVYRILTSTVEMNSRIWNLEKAANGEKCG